jgi:16S rRNA (cytosine967-C5)-methyltransferase
VDALLASDAGVRRAPVGAAEVAGLTDILTPEGDLRTLPCHLPHDDPRLGGLDGFYAARLIKS